MSAPVIEWLNADSRLFLSRGYLLPGVTPEARIRQICDHAESILQISGFADKLESYVHRGWVSFSSPVWSNFGAGRGLPISCFGCYVDDDTIDIAYKAFEVEVQTKHGGGTSAYFGDLRPRGAPVSTGGKSDGPIPFLQMFEVGTQVISQGTVRRGQFAAYLPVEHPDILDFLKLRSKGNPIQKMSFGVCISDDWMNRMIAGGKREREVWSELVRKKAATGYPYLFFTDTVNRAAPQVYRDKGIKIHASNLCSEIAIASSVDESFVCCLSSLNLLHYHDWKGTDLPETMIYFLDAVMSDFIRLTEGKRGMENARRFAINQRALGLGVLGWHSLLQSRMIPFESMEAKMLNLEVFKLIGARAQAATRELAIRFGEPPLLKGYGIRNVTTMAIAPTTSSSFILGQASPGIEPYHTNYYVEDLAKGEFTKVNPHLKALLAARGQDTREVWDSILVKGGSVQHLPFLSERERQVFLTFDEISQKEIIIQAAARQRFIDQAQSLNLKIPPSTPVGKVTALLVEAWRLGVKTIYYTRSESPVQTLARDILACRSCEA